jgi:hypothetical protein
MENKWLFQKNIWNEYGYDRFLNSIRDAEVSHEEVHIIPFTDTFDREIDFVPKHVFGSNRFINVCRSKGFPVFKSFKPIEDFYLEIDWVNGAGKDITWGKLNALPAETFVKPFFIKPYTEKFFTGKVCESGDDLQKIQLATSFIENEEDEMVRISYAVNIRDEVRFFIIGGEIISASLYRIKGINKQARIDETHIAWRRCKQLLRDYGVIDEAFVMDLGLVGEMNHSHYWKIVELNNINSAGLYETDTDAIVNAFKYL